LTYCTPADIVLASGTLLATETITSLIEMADRRIDAALAEAAVTGTAGDLDLETASIHYTIALIIDRGRLSSERPNSLSLGSDLSIGNNTQSEIDYHEQVARAAVNRFITRRRSGGVRVRRVNG
jgi:hypothetical protein